MAVSSIVHLWWYPEVRLVPPFQAALELHRLGSGGVKHLHHKCLGLGRPERGLEAQGRARRGRLGGELEGVSVARKGHVDGGRKISGGIVSSGAYTHFHQLYNVELCSGRQDEGDTLTSARLGAYVYRIKPCGSTLCTLSAQTTKLKAHTRTCTFQALRCRS